MTEPTKPTWGPPQQTRPPATPAPRPAPVPAPQPFTPGGRTIQRAALPPAAPPPGRSGPARPPQRRVRNGGSAWLIAPLLVVALVMLAVGGALVGYALIGRDLPPPDELRQRASQFSSTLIYDRTGGLLSELGDPNYGRRTAVRLDEIAPALVRATIATEDPNFYQHAGVDPVGLARAVYYAVRERNLSSGPGGSTITQQLVKLTFLSSERTMTRKIKEAILAAEITRRYSKDTILTIYLNEIYYGNLAYGIEAAAETYFGIHAAELTTGQAALLAGIPQGPAYYDPYTRLWEADGAPGAVKRRQAAVLRLMVEHGDLTPAQADAAWAEPIKLRELKQTYASKFPHFVQFARGEVESKLGPEFLSKGGLRIYTTMDPKLQAIAEAEVAAQVDRLKSQNATNGALVAIRPSNGEVLALVGSRSFYSDTISGQINMALAPRQPGSSIKPFTYLATFEMPASVSLDPAEARAARATGSAAQISAIEPPGYWTSSTVIMDIRSEFPDGANPPYVPVNYDGKEHGLVSVRSALGNSYNIPAVKALEHAGLARLKDVARRAGITTLTRPDYGLSLTLGGGEVTLLELTGAYAVLANGGVRAAPSAIACVLDAEGKLIWRGSSAAGVAACAQAPGTLVITMAPTQAVFNPQHVYLISDILSDAKAREPMFTGSPNMSLTGRPAAVKTGTTNDNRDAWTMGYTPDLAVGVWVGNADYKPMLGTAGASGAAPIWHNVMQRSLEGTPAKPFTAPPGVQRAEVCADSGTLPSPACPARRSDVFADKAGPLPAEYDLWQRVRVDKASGRRATEFTPADRVEERNVMIFPAKYRAWAAANGKPLLVDTPEFAFIPELALREPAGGARLTGRVAIAGRVHLPPPLVWRIEYGVGPDPLGWGIIAGPNQGDADGALGAWDTARPVAEHRVDDFTVRLAAYEPGIYDTPLAVSNVAYVRVVMPTGTPTTTPTITPSPTASATASATATTSPTARATASPTATRTPPAASPTAAPTGVTPAPSATGTPPAATPTAPPASPTASPVPASATPSPVPPTAAPSVTPLVGALRARITAPGERARLTGRVEITGSADGSGFASYRLEIAPGWAPPPEAWQPLAPAQAAPVTEGVLGILETGTLPVGPYTLRLRVLDTRSTALVAQVEVEIAR